METSITAIPTTATATNDTGGMRDESQEVTEKDSTTTTNHDGAVLESSATRTSNVEYSVFTRGQKWYIVFTASWAGFFSPVSSQIYFPALNTLARDLNVSSSLINLTLTSYMVSVAVPSPCHVHVMV